MHSILRDFLHNYLQTRTSGLVTETDVIFCILYTGTLLKELKFCCRNLIFRFLIRKFFLDF